MLHTHWRVWRRMIVPAFALAMVWPDACAHAHVHWSRVNGIDADTIALYHFDDAGTTVAPVKPPLSDGLGLTSISAANLLSSVADVPGLIFGPQALGLPGAITLRTTDTVEQLAGDLTIECWFKWTPQMTSSTLEVGLQSGARILIARDETTPANDRLGVAGTHGSFVPSTGFVNWPAVGDEEASLNEWRHLALTIHSEGIHHDDTLGHDVYSTGTLGRLYLNGHLLGIAPADVVDLSGVKVHDASRLTVIMRGGGIMVDELSIWRRDWSADGGNDNPFSDGRGGASGVVGWRDYCE